MKSSEIRSRFLDYFRRHGHEIVPTSPLVPINDPTLLFTNAGMVQFKDVFLGLNAALRAPRASSAACAPAASTTTSRTSAIPRATTFFEMLGNFSFGDYFKRDGIRYAWEFRTVEMKVPVERLWVTVFHDDAEAADIWLKEIGVDKKRFTRIRGDDNFWSMGDTGPCGPCTEIFYDHGAGIPGGPPGSAEADADRYIEIWNLVFMQYNRDAGGKLHPLPKPSVDTGMGLERLAAVMQACATTTARSVSEPDPLAAQLGVAVRSDKSLRVIAITSARRRSSSRTACCRRTRARLRSAPHRPARSSMATGSGRKNRFP